MDVSLALSPVAESVVVSAAQVETPIENVSGSVTVITSAQLRERQVESFGDALRTVPGLTVSRSGGRGALTSMFPRGGESDYTLVLVDGVRVNAFGGGLDLSLLDFGNIERIEFVPGPQSALYGADAIGGVVQVITSTAADACRCARRGGTGPARGAEPAVAPRRRHRRPVRPARSRGAAAWSAARPGASRAWRPRRARRSRTTTTGTGSCRPRWDGRRRAAPPSAARSDAFDNDRGFPGAVRLESHRRLSRRGSHLARPQPRPTGGRDCGDCPLGRVLDGRMRLRLSSTYGDLRSEFESPFGPSVFQTRRISARAQSDIAVSASSSLSAGIEGHQERARSTYITGASFEEVPIERTDIGYFGELRQQLGARAALTAGVRIEQLHRDALEPDPNPFAPRPAFAADSQLSPNPRVGLVYALRRDSSGSATTRVHAGAGTGIRPPGRVRDRVHRQSGAEAGAEPQRRSGNRARVSRHRGGPAGHGVSQRLRRSDRRGVAGVAGREPLPDGQRLQRARTGAGDQRGLARRAGG